MANSFVFPGGANTYVPELHGELLIEYSRNPAKFPIMRYINVRKVDKQRGYYPKMLNDNQSRYVNATDNVWADGNDAPELTYGNDEVTFPAFNCVRRAYTKKLGYLGVEQAGWDLLAQAGRLLAMQAMTARSRRVHQTLTVKASYTNTVAAVADGGITWANSTSTTPSIRKCITLATNKINQQTLGVVEPKDLYAIINPNVARQIATGQEWIDFIKQSPQSLPAWMGEGQYTHYNIPEFAMGVNWIVDDTVFNNAVPGAAANLAYSFPDDVCIVLSKQQAIESVGGAISTFMLFAYEEFTTNVYNDAKHRRYDLQVVENVDDSFIFSDVSGAYISTAA